MIISRLVSRLGPCTASRLATTLMTDTGIPAHNILCHQLRSLSTTPFSLKELRFHDKHEWVSLSDKIATVGISDYAQNSLGTIVYVQLPEVNSQVSKDDEVSCVESTKSASDIFSPLSGKIVEVNTNLEENPSLINSSCYDEGWIFKMAIEDENEFSQLMTEEAYNEYLKGLSN